MDERKENKEIEAHPCQRIYTNISKNIYCTRKKGTYSKLEKMKREIKKEKEYLRDTKTLLKCKQNVHEGIQHSVKKK